MEDASYWTDSAYGVGTQGEYQSAGCAPGIFFLTIPHPCLFCPPSPNNLEYPLAVSKNLARPLHPVYDGYLPPLPMHPWG